VVVRADEAAYAAAETVFAMLEVIGSNRLGIVREIAYALAAQGANVEKLATECSSAPMCGGGSTKLSTELFFDAGAFVI